MWVFLNDCTLSIVQDRDSRALLVRARVPGDIERFFTTSSLRSHGVVVKEMGPHEADYRFRAWVPRALVKKAMDRRLEDIDYPDFKGSVRDPERALAYQSVWGSWLADASRLAAGLPVFPGLGGGGHSDAVSPDDEDWIY